MRQANQEKELTNQLKEKGFTRNKKLMERIQEQNSKDNSKVMSGTSSYLNFVDQNNIINKSDNK